MKQSRVLVLLMIPITMAVSGCGTFNTRVATTMAGDEMLSVTSAKIAGMHFRIATTVDSKDLDALKRALQNVQVKEVK